MSNFTCQDIDKYKIKTPTPKSSSKNIQRFLDAHNNGIKYGSKVRKEGTEYRMDRGGVNFKTVLDELHESSIKKKTQHYIWYIFPQPVYKKSGISTTSQCFYVDEEEVELFLKNTQLRKNLNQALRALENKNLNAVQLSYYFSPQGDHYKFSSFRRFFLKVIKKIEKDGVVSPTTQNSIQSIKAKLLKLNIIT